MARVRTIQNSFNAGEWSPLMNGRSDLAKYHNAAETVQNMICLKQGGVTRRPGTRFVAEVKTSAKKTRLIPFIFSTLQAYIIEVGDTYMRFYKNGARIESPPGTPVEISTPYLEAELFDIHFAQSADVLYVAHGKHFPMKLSRTSDTSWTLGELGTDPAGGAGNKGFLHGPFLDERIDITITPSATSGAGITLTASSALFVSSHVGALFQLKHGTTLGYAEITSFTSSTIVTATTFANFGAATASDSFREGAWSDFRGLPSCVTLFQQRLWYAATANNPDTIWGSQSADYENFDAGTALDNEAVTFTLASNKVNVIRWIAPSRTLLVGTTGQEWQVGDPSTSTPITPGNPSAKAETTFGSNNVSPIQVYNALLFLQGSGTRLREYAFQFQTDSYSAPDMTILAEHITAGGITQMDYQQEKNSVVWAVRADGALIGLTYERDQDVEAWHRHITGPGQDSSDGKFESVAVIPNPTVTAEDQTWVIVKRGIPGTASLTILDWSSALHLGISTIVTYHVIGHGLSVGNPATISGLSQPVFNGAEFVSGVVDADHFTVIYSGHAHVKEGGTGGFVSFPTSTKRYVEYLDTQSGFYGGLEVDAGLTYSGVATATLSGLGHLEGQAVDILASGVVYPPQVVSSGQVTGLSPTVTQAEVGLHFESTAKNMRIEAGDDAGTAQGAPKRFNEITVRLYQSAGATIGTEAMDQTLFTGDKRISNLGWDRDGQITIRQTKPLPLTVLAIIGVLNVGG